MKKAISKDIIPISISVILMGISIGVTIFTDYLLSYKHYIGFTLICISTLLYFKSKKLFAYFFVITLTLGITNLIQIFIVNLEINIGPINLNLTFLILLLIFLILNKELLNKMFPEKEITEKDLQMKNVETEKLVKSYQRKFESKTELELKNIAKENSGYVNEAKTAAKTILKIKYGL